MPHLCKLPRSSSRTLTRCPNNKKPSVVKKFDIKMKSAVKPKSSDDHFSHCVATKKNLRDLESKLFLPFLVGAPKLAECRVCEDVIYRGEEVSCSVPACVVTYHSRCASDRFGVLDSSKDIKCPQHACFLCKKKLIKSSFWRCSRCDLASHDKCAAFPEYVLHSDERPGNIVCWRHSTDSPPLKPAVPTCSIEEVFRCLPLPYVEEEFKIDLTWRNITKDYVEPPSYAPPAAPISSIEEVFRRLPLPNVEKEFKIDLCCIDTTRDNLEPPSYVHIKCNKYLTKEKRYDVDDNTGCTTCGTGICNEDCECRCLYFSCTSACECSEKCTNRPFQEGKKVKVVMTQHCGWGVEAVEVINEGDFIIEYVGEVINDALCEKRFRDMKQKGNTKSYVVEVRKDFNIDAIFKGNESRFVNHSCDPNCTMEQWEVNGETCLGIFAAKSIKPGEELTFDYRFEQFGPEVECHCGAINCHGYLGTKKTHMVNGSAKHLKATSN